MSEDIFISYATKDQKTAETICAALETRGFKCWISTRNILPSENYAEAIVRAIRAAKVMLFIFSANSNNSEEVKKEIALASQHRLMVIPLRVEDVVPNEALQYEFVTRQWINFFEDWELAMEQLTNQIVKIVPPTGVITSGTNEGLDETSKGKPASTSLPYNVPAAGPAAAAVVRGDAFAKIGQYKLAIDEYNEAIRIDPSYPHSFHNRGNAYLNMGELDLAIVDFSEAIRLKPDYASAFNNRGNTFVAKLLYDKAIEDFDAAIRFRPDFALAYNNRGYAWFCKSDFDKAIADFSEALRLKPDFAIALESRAKAYERKNRADLARKDREAAAAIGNKAKPSSRGGTTAGKGMQPWQIIGLCVAGLVVLLTIVIIASVNSQPAPVEEDAASEAAPEMAPADASAAPDTATETSSDDTTVTQADIDLCNTSDTSSSSRYLACSKIANDPSQSDSLRAHASNEAGAWDEDNKYYEDAVSEFTSALNFASNDDSNRKIYLANRGIAYNNMAYYRNKTQDYNLAINDFNAALAIDSSYAAAQYNRGIAYKNMGRTADGQADEDAAIQNGYKPTN